MADKLEPKKPALDRQAPTPFPNLKEVLQLAKVDIDTNRPAN